LAGVGRDSKKDCKRGSVSQASNGLIRSTRFRVLFLPFWGQFGSDRQPAAPLALGVSRCWQPGATHGTKRSTNSSLFHFWSILWPKRLVHSSRRLIWAQVQVI